MTVILSENDVHVSADITNNGTPPEEAITEGCGLSALQIIIVTSMADSGFLKRAKEAGIESFWYKESSAEELLDIMERTINGESVYPDKAPDIKIGNASSSEFTQLELEVLRLLVRGLTDSAIAEQLHISVPAVRWHIKELFQKTGYNNRVLLACDVINKDLIVPGY